MSESVSCKNLHPVPDRHDHWAEKFRNLDVGESVFLENSYGRVAAYKFGKCHGKTFRTRKDGIGFRVWRVA